MSPHSLLPPLPPPGVHAAAAMMLLTDHAPLSTSNTYASAVAVTRALPSAKDVMLLLKLYCFGRTVDTTPSCARSNSADCCDDTKKGSTPSDADECFDENARLLLRRLPPWPPNPAPMLPKEQATVDINVGPSNRLAGVCAEHCEKPTQIGDKVAAEGPTSLPVPYSDVSLIATSANASPPAASTAVCHDTVQAVIPATAPAATGTPATTEISSEPAFAPPPQVPHVAVETTAKRPASNDCDDEGSAGSPKRRRCGQDSLLESPSPNKTLSPRAAAAVCQTLEVSAASVTVSSAGQQLGAAAVPITNTQIPDMRLPAYVPPDEHVDHVVPDTDGPDVPGAQLVPGLDSVTHLATSQPDHADKALQLLLELESELLRYQESAAAAAGAATAGRRAECVRRDLSPVTPPTPSACARDMNRRSPARGQAYDDNDTDSEHEAPPVVHTDVSATATAATTGFAAVAPPKRLWVTAYNLFAREVAHHRAIGRFSPSARVNDLWRMLPNEERKRYKIAAAAARKQSYAAPASTVPSSPSPATPIARNWRSLRATTPATAAGTAPTVANLDQAVAAAFDGRSFLDVLMYDDDGGVDDGAGGGSGGEDGGGCGRTVDGLCGAVVNDTAALDKPVASCAVQDADIPEKLAPPSSATSTSGAAPVGSEVDNSDARAPADSMLLMLASAAEEAAAVQENSVRAVGGVDDRLVPLGSEQPTVCTPTSSG
ncbi:hypothetical protein HK405_009709 [Cladochytrium tenue]|nr:hypothetical protein HK405_009709 [Cladochytrium tenue]